MHLLLLLLVSVAGVAAFGHLVNDWADVDADLRGGKPNRLTNISNASRGKVVVASLMIGLLPWLPLPRRPSAWLAL